MKLINKLRKYVHSIVFVNKLKQGSVEAQNEFNTISLKDFCNTFEYANTSLKKWVYESIKKVYEEVVRNETIKIDIINSKPSTTDSSEKCKKLIEILRKMFESMIRYTNEDTFDKKTIVFLKLIYTNKLFIPFKFYTLFELSRMKIIDGSIIGLKEQQKSMIYSIHIILKILTNFILIEMNYSPDVKSSTIRKNLKIIASVIYHETISLYTEHCKIEQEVTNTEKLVLSQKLRGKRKERIPIKAGVERSYARALKVYNEKVKKQEETGDEISTLLSNINTKLQNYMPDNNPNQVEFILKSLYTKDEIKVYYSQSEFNLKELFYDWVKQLILVIHKVK